MEPEYVAGGNEERFISCKARRAGYYSVAPAVGVAGGRMFYPEPKMIYISCNSNPICEEEADEWWGDITDAGKFMGCSYVENNIRPMNNSIMRDHRVDDYEVTYGIVNEEHMREKLEMFG